MTIDILVKIYKKWGENNDIENIGSADEELMWNSNLDKKQSEWLEKFIEIWDRMQNRDYKKWSINKNLMKG
tara:strand:- start:198 stop:410 length:213 start_codon:yes stop_codon:yes gene_type:complete